MRLRCCGRSIGSALALKLMGGRANKLLLLLIGASVEDLDRTEYLMRQLSGDTEGESLRFIGLRDDEKSCEAVTDDGEHLEKPLLPVFTRFAAIVSIAILFSTGFLDCCQ